MSAITAIFATFNKDFLHTKFYQMGKHDKKKKRKKQQGLKGQGTEKVRIQYRRKFYDITSRPNSKQKRMPGNVR